MVVEFNYVLRFQFASIVGVTCKADSEARRSAPQHISAVALSVAVRVAKLVPTETDDGGRVAGTTVKHGSQLSVVVSTG